MHRYVLFAFFDENAHFSLNVTYLIFELNKEKVWMNKHNCQAFYFDPFLCCTSWNILDKNCHMLKLDHFLPMRAGTTTMIKRFGPESKC